MPNKPVPTKLKMVRGTQKKCRVNNREPKPQKAPVRCPAGLSKEARTHWRKVARVLSDAGVLTVMDVDALRIYCETFARWDKAMEHIRDEGMVVAGSRGPILSPYLRIVNTCQDQMARILTEFGMTPSSRTKVATTEGDDGAVDPWANFG